MDLFYSNNFDGFCIVSSDSDFTRLAQRLRESGKFVLGFGEHKTPRSFIQSCNEFIFTESVKNTNQEEYTEILVQAMNHALKQSKNPWISLSVLGTVLDKLNPSFKPQKFGFRTLTKLVEATDCFEISTRNKITGVKLKTNW